MMPIRKVAIFLMMIGMEKSQSIIALMDNSEIKTIVSEVRSLTVLSQEIQEDVWTEFKELGYEEKMKPSETLNVIRLLFNGGTVIQ